MVPTKEMEYKYTKLGHYSKGLNSIKLFDVSNDGNRVYGHHVYKQEPGGFYLYVLPIVKIVAFRLNHRILFFYDYQHKGNIYQIKAVERLNLLVSGGDDHKVVLHDLDSGKTIKVLEFQSGIRTFKQIGPLFLVKDCKAFLFIDLIRRRILKDSNEVMNLPLNSMEFVSYILFSCANQKQKEIVFILNDFDSSKKYKLKVPSNITLKVFEYLDISKK